MILVDTSVWADHLRSTDTTMHRLLMVGEVAIHPFIIGELAMGNLASRDLFLRDLEDLPQVVTGEQSEVLRFVSRYSLFGSGIGYIDAHLLVSVQLTTDTRFWTRDKRLLAIADRLGLLMPDAPHRVS